MDRKITEMEKRLIEELASTSTVCTSSMKRLFDAFDRLDDRQASKMRADFLSVALDYALKKDYDKIYVLLEDTKKRLIDIERKHIKK